MLGGVGESVLFSNKQRIKQTNKQKEDEEEEEEKRKKKKKGGGGVGLGTSLKLTPEYILILKQMSKKVDLSAGLQAESVVSKVS